jgi:OCT family organic cation transporter-like MFS transporter 18
MLYLSKMPSAFMHPYMVAQTFMAQQTTDDNRPEAFALLVTAYTIGGTIGPTLGGWLGASGDYYLGAKVSACGMLLSVVLAAVVLEGGRSTETSQKKRDCNEKPKQPSVFIGYRTVLTNPAVRFVILTKLCSSTLNSVYETMYPIILKENFALNEQQMGYVLSTSMLLNAIVSKFVVGRLTRKLTGSYFCGYCLACMSFCYFGASVVMPGSAGLDVLAGLIPIHPAIPFAGLTLLIFAAAFARSSAFTGVNTTVVPGDLRGTAISMEHTMFSMSRSVTPIFTSWLSAAMGSGAVCAIVAASEAVNVLSWSFIAIPLVKQAQEKLRLPKPELESTSSIPKSSTKVVVAAPSHGRSMEKATSNSRAASPGIKEDATLPSEEKKGK